MQKQTIIKSAQLLIKSEKYYVWYVTTMLMLMIVKNMVLFCENAFTACLLML